MDNNPKIRLETIIDEELFKQEEKGILGKVKTGTGKVWEWVAHNSSAAGNILSGIIGISTYYISSKVLSSYMFLIEKLNEGGLDPNYVSKNSIIMALGTAGLTWSFSTPFIRNKIGKKISTAKGETPTNEKTNEKLGYTKL